MFEIAEGKFGIRSKRSQGIIIDGFVDGIGLIWVTGTGLRELGCDDLRCRETSEADSAKDTSTNASWTTRFVLAFVQTKHHFQSSNHSHERPLVLTGKSECALYKITFLALNK